MYNECKVAKRLTNVIFTGILFRVRIFSAFISCDIHSKSFKHMNSNSFFQPISKPMPVKRRRNLKEKHTSRFLYEYLNGY